MNKAGQNDMAPNVMTLERRVMSPRRGAVSIWAIVCLVFVTTLGVTLGRLALMGSRHMIQERHHSQAGWLAQSGWLLAKARLQRNPDYKGETWNVPAAELGGADSGRVRIEVATPNVGPSPASREIKVIAEFPVGSDRRVQITRQGTLPVSKP